MAFRINTKEEDRTVLGNKRFVSGTITLVDSYATGGEVITAKQLGFDTLRHFSVFGEGSNVPVYHPSSNKVQIFTEDGTELAVDTDVMTGEQLTFVFDAFGW